ncbi:hypothetical protein SAMN05443270_3098 [Lacrimispora sphenoides]|nr:hypothetical protein SAMN05443270_3098 [Lacrimispora sphenoides]
MEGDGIHYLGHHMKLLISAETAPRKYLDCRTGIVMAMAKALG